MRGSYNQTFILLVGCLLVLFVGIASGAGVGVAQEELGVTVNVPDEATANEQVAFSASISVPELPGDYERELTVVFYSDGQQIGSETITVSDGETTQIEVTHTFEEPGEKEIEAEASVTFGGQEYSGQDSASLDVAEPQEKLSIDGASFGVPESLEDEVKEYRNDVSQELEAQAFVLATEDELYIVFTKQEPTEGVATVEGNALDRDLSTENLSFGVVVASSASFDTTGTETSIQEVSENSEQYRLELVRINSHYRRVSTLTDPDNGENYTLSTTSGVLIDNPRSGTALFQNVGSNARELSQNTSTKQIDTTLSNPSRPHLHTFSFETEFWTDAEAEVDAIVLEPQSAARQFIDEYDQAGVAHSEDGEPILYVVEEDFQPRQVENVESIKSQSESLDGEVVETEVRLYQERISVQETLEHNTGCDADLLEVQTPQGPVCVNVVQDNLLHGGVAWNSVPQSRGDTLLVMGVSSLHQDSPEEFEEGRYRIEGEVVSTSRIDESLPEGSVLVIYDMERLGDIDYDSVADEGKKIIETRTDDLSTRLRQQVGEDGIEIETGRMAETIQSATPGEPATISFSRTNYESVSIQQANINVTTQIQNAQVNVAKVASLPSGVSRPPGQSIRILNISSSIADSKMENASFQLRVSKDAIPEGKDVTVSRYHNGNWNTLNTTAVEETDTELIISVKTPGFSYFSISTQNSESGASDSNQEESTTDSEEQSGDETSSANDNDESAIQSDDADGTGTTGSSTPGFTVLSFLVAVILFFGWQLRQ